MKSVFSQVALGALALALAGCGMIADKNNIRVAEMDGQPITRGDLNSYIRAFPENERPQISNQGDLLMVLNRMIDERIKENLATEQGGNLPQITSRDQAREQFFVSLGDEQDQYRAVWAMEVPADGQATPLMQTYGLTAQGMTDMKAYIDQRTDALLQRIRSEEVLMLMVANAVKSGELKVDEKALELEYKFRAGSLRRPESVTFTAIRFAASAEGGAEAARTRQELDAGGNFDAVAAQYRGKDNSTVFQGTLQNNPQNTQMASFWAQASGAAVGALLGPLFLPETQQVAVNPDGTQREVTSPPCYAVCRVDAREDERTLSLEESRMALAPPLLIAQMVRKLREQHGVKLYEENLSDPGDFAGSAEKPLA